MGTLGTLLGSFGIKQIMDIISPFLPTDEATKGKIIAELESIQVEQMKQKTDYIEKLGRIKDLIIPCFLFSLLAMYVMNYLSEYIHIQFGLIPPVLVVDETLVQICETIIMFLFGSKTISRFSNAYVEKHYSK